MEVFFFKEGYLRTSAFGYKLDNCQDDMVHLTNNAVQMKSGDYGRYEDGNQLDFKQFQEYLDKDFNEREVKEGRPKISVKHDLVEDIKYTITKTIDSVKRKLDPAKRKGTFEILGYDFMVDYDMSVWLIECNTNPCFDESSKILEILLPRMLDDAFKLSIDKNFINPLC